MVQETSGECVRDGEETNGMVLENIKPDRTLESSLTQVDVSGQRLVVHLQKVKKSSKYSFTNQESSSG